MINIAIDGPSGSGKSTLAKELSKKLGFIYLDTGALYRSIGLYAFRKGISLENITEIINYLPEIEIKVSFIDGKQVVLLLGENVNDKIRTNEISMYASKVSAVPEVRSFLLDLQKNIAKENNVIMDGRDIGTVILPNADVKFFVIVSDEIRAKRRFLELQEKSSNITLEEVKKTMAERDFNDKNRKIAPAIKANDAIELDNSSDFDTTFNTALSIIVEKTGVKVD